MLPTELSWWYGWMVLLVCTFAKALKSFGQNNTLFLSIPGIEHDINLTHTQTGLLMCLACLASAVTQPFAGRFQDRFGGRLCIPAALVLLAVFLWIVAVAKSAGIVLLGFVGLRTFGLGMLDTFTAACVNQWFVKSRGTALSLMTVGFFVGTGAGSVQVLAAVKRRAGWRAALKVGGLLCTASAPICALLLRSTPEGVGLLPDPPSAREKPAPAPAPGFAPAVEGAAAGEAAELGEGSTAPRPAWAGRPGGKNRAAGAEEDGSGPGPGRAQGESDGARDSRGRSGSERADECAEAASTSCPGLAGAINGPQNQIQGPGPPPPLPPAAAAAAAAVAGLPAVIEGVTLRTATRALAFWLLGLFTFGFFFQASGTDFHLIGMVAEAGSVDVAATLSLANALSSAVSSLTVGYALDRRWVYPRVVLLISAVLLLAYTLLLSALDASWLGVCAGLIKGAADACSNIGVPFAVAARSCRVFAQRNVDIFGRAHNGEIFSINRSLGVIASGIGPLVFGFARDRLGLYKSTLRASIVVPAAMALAAVLMPSHGRAFDPHAALRSAWEGLKGESGLFAGSGRSGGAGDGGRGGLPGSHREMVSLLGDGPPDDDLEGPTGLRAGRL